jgi:hypothetical protein
MHACGWVGVCVHDCLVTRGRNLGGTNRGDSNAPVAPKVYVNIGPISFLHSALQLFSFARQSAVINSVQPFLSFLPYLILRH